VNRSEAESIQPYLDQQRALVEAELDRVLPGPEEHPPSIHQAMRHSVFAGGKRLRPILCLESGRLFGGDLQGLLRVGCALELIHTYSLIHDDLPALDNDDLRRGKPTCHKAFGEATAILAGDALLTLAFELLSAPGCQDAHRELRVVHEIARAIGTRAGMVGGQVVDLEVTDGNADSATLEYIHSAKTGSFIRASVRCGAIYAGASEDDLSRLTLYGEKIGLAFQIVDDLLDVLGSREALGKEVRKDRGHHKATYPALYGVERSKLAAKQLVSEACSAIEPYGIRAKTLCEIANFLLVRDY